MAQVRYVTGNKILRILKAKGKTICNNLCKSPSELFRPGHVKMITDSYGVSVPCLNQG